MSRRSSSKKTHSSLPRGQKNSPNKPVVCGVFVENTRRLRYNSPTQGIHNKEIFVFLKNKQRCQELTPEMLKKAMTKKKGSLQKQTKRSLQKSKGR
jgi:hypothetical protein